MPSEAEVKINSLYNTDYQLWLAQTVTHLKAKEFSQLDLENLIEEIGSLGKSDKRAIVSDLTQLCEHLLKIKYWESERETCFSLQDLTSGTRSHCRSTCIYPGTSSQ